MGQVESILGALYKAGIGVVLKCFLLESWLYLCSTLAVVSLYHASFGHESQCPNVRVFRLCRRKPLYCMKNRNLVLVWGLIFWSSFQFQSIRAQGQPYHVLDGHRPGTMASITPTGAFDPSASLSLAIGLPTRDPAGVQERLREMSDRSSTNYGRAMTREQFVEQFAPTEADYQNAMNYATAHGLAVTSTYKNRLLFNVTGSAADIEKVFHVKLRLYPHPTEKRLFFAPDRDPSVDPQFRILDVSGLDNFGTHHSMDAHSRPRGATQIQSYGQLGSGPSGELIGKDHRNAYAPGVTLDGYGQRIGIFSYVAPYPQDIVAYERFTGLGNVAITNISVNGFSTTPTNGMDDLEIAGDIEVAMSMAPGATIMVYESGDMASGFNQMAVDDMAKQISCSWGDGASSPSPMIIGIVNELQLQGQSVFIASGDYGATQLSPGDPGGYTNETICGGTVLTLTGQGGGWQSETTWTSSGGGWYTDFAIPPYQQGLNMSTNGGSTHYRNIPDVAGAALNIFGCIDITNEAAGLEGTSFAAPMWAGFAALINEQRTDNGLSSIVNFNDAIYSIGNGPSYAKAFHDITSGNNTNSASPGGFFAVTGYDLCTGWGTPNGTNLINLLAPETDSLQISPGFGFTAYNPYGNNAAADTVFTLANAGGSSISWKASAAASWLEVLTTSGTIGSGANASVEVGLNALVVANMGPGYYEGLVTFSNLTTGATQNRLFVLNLSAGAQPLIVSGFNAGVIAPNTATSIRPQATSFDTTYNYAFYEQGLFGSSQGLPPSGSFTSSWDGQTIFQLGPYGQNDVLLLGDNYSTSGTLTFTTPQSLNSLVVLATSANAQSTSAGTMVLNFTNGTSSKSFNFNAADWFTGYPNVALHDMGRINLNVNNFTPEVDGQGLPSLYQTTIPLRALGLTQAISSITFTMPSGAGNTGIFALSGVSGALSGLSPVITQQPQSITTSNASMNAAFSVGVSGAPPFTYQWYSNSIPLPDGVMPTLNFDPGSLANASSGAYYVVVSNLYGSATSATAFISIPPQFIQQPLATNYNVFQGGSVSITAAATSPLPIAYQWLFNGEAVAGATGTELVLTNLQFTNAGSYRLEATTTEGETFSDTAMVNVLPQPSASYPQAVLQLKPLAYWRLDETNGTTAYDYAGGHNGVYTNVILGQPGYGSLGANGIGTETSEQAAQFGPNGVQSYVSLPTIDLSVTNGGNGEFTIAAWVNANSSTVNFGPILSKIGGDGACQFSLDCGYQNTYFEFDVRNSEEGYSAAPTSVSPDNSWHLLVGVCDQAKGTLSLYIDGAIVGTGSVPPNAGILSRPTVPASIGAAEIGTPYEEQLVGLVDDVAIFTNALTSAQLQPLFNAARHAPTIAQQPVSSWSGPLAGAATNQVVATATSGVVTYQWYGPSGVLVGATNSSLILTPLTAKSAGNYYVVISNAIGSVQSANALLSVVGLPTAPYPAAALALNPLGYWRLNETKGTIAFDCANGNNGVYTNVILGQPGYGSLIGGGTGTDPSELAVQFGPTNGAQSYVSLPTIDLSAGLGHAAEFSIVAWVKASPSTVNGAGILAKGSGGGGEQFCLDCGGTSNAFRFFVRDFPGNAYLATSTTVPDGKWHMLAGVCDQVHTNILLYVDGTRAAVGVLPGGEGVQDSSVPASIGAREGGLNQPFNLQLIGLMDDAAIFTNALTASQILNLYGEAADPLNPVGFNGYGLNWSANQTGAYTTPLFTNNVLSLTDGAANEARSVFFQQPQYIGAFKASFTYQDVGGGGADGVAFVLQNDPRGASAFGDDGADLGLGGPAPITPSAALELNLYAGNSEASGYTFLTNGLTGAFGANGNYQKLPFALGDADPSAITLYYASGRLALSMTDMTLNSRFTTNLNVGNLTNIVGGATAYVGFTGADGGITSMQTITNFSFVSIPTANVSVASGNVVIMWPAAIAGYTLQQNTNLNTTNWVNVAIPPTVVNGQNQFAVPWTPTSTYYRLNLQF